MGVALQNLLKKILHSVLKQTLKLAKLLSLGWVNFTWTSLLTVCVANLKVEANVGAPQVSYRETFRASTQAEGKFVRQSGGKGQYGHVWIEFTPNEEGKGFEFENAIVGGVVPREYIPAVEKGLEDSMANGVLAGYPLVDIKSQALRWFIP